MKQSFFILMTHLVLMTVLSIGCCPVQYDSDYKGRVVDAETGKPIEGAVVLGTWYFVSSSVAGAHHSFDDCRETTTDAKGEFTVPGQGLRVLSCLDTMHTTVFKSGYESLYFYWDYLKFDILLSKKVRWDGEIPVIPLRKLTMDERMKQQETYITSAITWDMIPLFAKEINKNRIELGRKPYSIEKEKFDEIFM